MRSRDTVVVIPDEEDGGCAAYVPALPNCLTRGDTLAHAAEMAGDAAATLLTRFAAHDEEIAVEAPGAVVRTVEVAVPAGALA